MLKTAIRLFFYVFKYPELFVNRNLEKLGSLYAFLFKVAEDEKPYMVQFGYVDFYTKEKYTIVSIWAGIGVGADPLKRIEELVEENEYLKKKISNSTGE
jgi:hypothetical protein